MRDFRGLLKLAGLEKSAQSTNDTVSVDRGGYPNSANNPFNLRYYPEIAWHGQISTGLRRGDFARFDTATNGLRAGIRNAINMASRYFPDGMSISNYVHRASPASDNNDEATHAANISSVSGIPSDQVLDTSDDGVMVDFARGTTRSESGSAASNWFTPQEYTNAVQSARQSI